MALEAVREDMIRGGRCRNRVNKDVSRIRRMFRWAAAKKLLPVAVYESLATVEGRSAARETAPVRPVADHVVALIQLDCRMDVLRSAISAISPPRVRRCVMPDFGWTEGRCSYLVPGGRITADGFVEAGPTDELRLDLGECPQAAVTGSPPGVTEAVTAVTDALTARTESG